MTDPWWTTACTAWQVDVVSLYLQEAWRSCRYDERLLTLVLWRAVFQNAVMSSVWFTVSKVFDKSIAIATLRRVGERGLLTPVADLWESNNTTEVVDLRLRKLYWVSARLRWILRNGKISCLNTFMAEQRSKIGRYEDPKWQGLHTLGISTQMFFCEINVYCYYYNTSLLADGLNVCRTYWQVI